jgi:hypothetical protein
MKTTAYTTDRTPVTVEQRGGEVAVGVSVFGKFLDPHAASVLGWAMLREAVQADATARGVGPLSNAQVDAYLREGLMVDA